MVRIYCTIFNSKKKETVSAGQRDGETEMADGMSHVVLLKYLYRYLTYNNTTLHGNM